MKCQAFIASRGSLPLGNQPLSSMVAYTAASSSSMSQCRPIVIVP